MKSSIVAKLEALYERHEEVQALLGDAATIADQIIPRCRGSMLN